MSRFRIFKLVCAALVAGAICQAQPLLACAMCYAAPEGNSTLAAGMNWGIMSLLVVVVSVLASIGSFFIFLARKAAATARAVPQPAPKLEATQKA